ncbi:MAG: flavodoxin [Kiritimatiellae bacterium]|jgi:flavodoxin|nr:flavodoxin [Kiritimatiellia bacterium]
MNTLVLYYSFTGNTRLLAEGIAAGVDADICELRNVKQVPKGGMSKIFWAGREVFMNKFPEIEDVDIDFDEYDVIFIGTPVWAFTYAPPFNTFFKRNKFDNKKMAFFCCHGGRKGKIFDKIKEVLSGNIILGCVDFVEPCRNDSQKCVEGSVEWAKEMLDSST